MKIGDNKESTLESILKVLKEKLLDHKLYLNEVKESSDTRPFVTAISAAKHHIEKLFDSILQTQV